MNQEAGSTVKHVNFEWPECLVGNGQDTQGTSRGDYNISIHQNYKLNGNNFYTIFNLPISVTNNISRFPGAGQLSSNPVPGPLGANGGRVDCATIENPVVDFEDLVQSVNNPPGQPFQDIQVQTGAGNSNGGNGGNNNGGSNSGSNSGNNGGNNGGNGGNNGGGSGGNNGGNYGGNYGGNGGNGGNGRGGGDFGNSNGNGQGQISPGRPTQAIGGAAQGMSVSLRGAIVISMVAVLITVGIF
jgi:hypothetical protein